MTEQSESSTAAIHPTRTLNRRQMLKLTGAAAAVALTGAGAYVAAPSAGEIGETAQEISDRVRQRWLHNANHYPIEKDSIEKGRRIPARPYLTMPLSTDVGEDWSVPEAWELSEQEKAIIGDREHGGIDFAAPYGALVVAPADGFACYTFWTFRLRDVQSGQLVEYEGKSIGLGLGNIVQVYIPEVKRFLVLGHLSEVDDKIPFSKPTATPQGGWYPTNHDLPIEQLVHSPFYIRVKRGDVLGKVGNSGLSWPYDPAYHGEKDAPKFRDQSAHPSWDEPHVHMEEYGRDEKGHKEHLRDPMAIYGTGKYYPSPTRPNLPLGQDPLFLVGSDGLPQFA